MKTSTITLSWSPAEGERPSGIRAIKVLRELGALRPGFNQPYGLLEAKLMYDRMRDEQVTMSFDIPAGVSPLIAPGVAVAFAIVEGPGDIAAEQINVEVGLRRLELFANATSEEPF